ncbi:MAG: nucleoside hydrolase [Planctomycetota bacterium]
MLFPPLDPAFVLSRLTWPADRCDLVLDTDTYNEIDDQFALVYALLSKPRFDLQAVFAAPFHNKRSSGPADGMAKSYDEIARVLGILDVPTDGFVYRGSDAWLPDPQTSVPSDARDELIRRARAQPDGRPLYVAAIGAITNVVSALIEAPDIREKIVVLWLGGHPLYWHTAAEFNLEQDSLASRVLLDSGVPLVLFPCQLVAEMIKTTTAELDAHLQGHSSIGDYLAKIFREYEYAPVREPGGAKEIWDLAPLAWLMDQAWVETTIEPCPVLTDDRTWSRDARRPPIRVAQHIHRDALFTDLFAKAAQTNPTPRPAHQ